MTRANGKGRCPTPFADMKGIDVTRILIGIDRHWALIKGVLKNKSRCKLKSVMERSIYV